MSCQRCSMYCGSWPMRRPAHCSSVSFAPPSPTPVMPPSVSTVTTMSLWLKSVFRVGGEYARTRVIFILGRAARAGGGEARPAAELAASAERKKDRRFTRGLLEDAGLEAYAAGYPHHVSPGARWALATSGFSSIP